MRRYNTLAQRQRPTWYRLFPNASIVLFFLTMAVMLWALDSREAEQLRTALARDAGHHRTELWTTWDVVIETITLLRYRHSSAAAIGFLPMEDLSKNRAQDSWRATRKE